MKLSSNLTGGIFSKKAIKLLTGSGIAQFIPFFTAPVLSRIYSPEDFGVLGLYMATTLILTKISNLEFQHLILTEQSMQKEVKALNQLVITALVITTALLYFAILYFFSTNKLYNETNLVLPIHVYFSASCVVFNIWLIKKEKYKYINITRILTPILIFASSIYLYDFFESGVGLIIATFIGASFNFILFMVIFGIKYFKGIFKVNFNQIKLLAYNNKDYPIFSCPSQFLNTWITQFPVYFFSILGSSSLVGCYNYAKRILTLPSDFSSLAMNDLFKAKAAKEIQHKGNCKELFKKTFFQITALAIFPYFIVFIFADSIFTIYLGEQWAFAGDIARILVPVYFLRFITSPLSYVFLILKKQKLDLIIHIGVSIVFLILFFTFQHFSFSEIELIYVFSFVYVIFYLIFLIISQKIAYDKLP